MALPSHLTAAPAQKKARWSSLRAGTVCSNLAHSAVHEAWPVTISNVTPSLQGCTGAPTTGHSVPWCSQLIHSAQVHRPCLLSLAQVPSAPLRLVTVRYLLLTACATVPLLSHPDHAHTARLRHFVLSIPRNPSSPPKLTQFSNSSSL